MCVLNTPGFNRVAIAYSTLEYARIFMLLRSVPALRIPETAKWSLGLENGNG